MHPALVHGEFEAVDALIRRGAEVDLVVTAALGRYDEAGKLLGDADVETRQRALSMAAQYGHVDVVRVLLDAGAEADRYAPVGCYSHATPLHQAVAAGAVHLGRPELARYLENSGNGKKGTR